MIFEKPRRRTVHRVFIHCSASDAKNRDSVATIRGWHKQQGWADIGYHFVITRDGVVHVGRPIEHKPAAQKGNNKGTIAICLTGLKKFTTEQVLALADFCMAIDDAYEHEITFHGHCEVNPMKTCPVFDYREVLRLDPAGQMTRHIKKG